MAIGLMTVEVMILRVRYQCADDWLSNSVCKGNGCEDDGCAGHNGSVEADRGSWLRGVAQGSCTNNDGYSSADGSCRDDSRDDCFRGNGCRHDGCRGKNVTGTLIVMSVRMAVVRMMTVRVKVTMMMTVGMMAEGVDCRGGCCNNDGHKCAHGSRTTRRLMNIGVMAINKE